MSFFETAARAKSYLREHGRVSVGGLRREFNLDDEGLEQLVEELVDVQQVAAREGKVLLWVGVATSEAGAGGGAERSPEAAPADAERRQLTVMFCDLVGSTPLSQPGAGRE